jgi:hypothetical protein
MIITDAADVASKGAEVQQAGIAPLGIAGYLLISVIGSLMFGRHIKKRDATNCLEPIAANRDANFFKEGSLMHDILREIPTGNGATQFTRSSDQRGGVESIQLGIFPVDGKEHAACIIMNAPSRGYSLYISAFPPYNMENPGLDENERIRINTLLSATDPRKHWLQGEPPSISYIQMSQNVTYFSLEEYKKNLKTLHAPPDMTVHQYAVEIIRKARAYETMSPLSEDDRKRGVICCSNRRLSTFLEDAGGETAILDIGAFRKELDLVTRALGNSKSDSKVIPGLGEPFPSPWQAKEERASSPDHKGVRFF